jgi:hypothetical protein
MTFQQTFIIMVIFARLGAASKLYFNPETEPSVAPKTTPSEARKTTLEPTPEHSKSEHDYCQKFRTNSTHDLHAACMHSDTKWDYNYAPQGGAFCYNFDDDHAECRQYASCTVQNDSCLPFYDAGTPGMHFGDNDYCRQFDDIDLCLFKDTFANATQSGKYCSYFEGDSLFNCQKFHTCELTQTDRGPVCGPKIDREPFSFDRNDFCARYREQGECCVNYGANTSTNGNWLWDQIGCGFFDADFCMEVNLTLEDTNDLLNCNLYQGCALTNEDTFCFVEEQKSDLNLTIN